MIYADHNATTALLPSAREAMAQAMEVWGNPSSAHQMGRKAREIVENSRQKVALALGVSPQEVVFTSGGSEANTLVLLGSHWQQVGSFRLLTSKVEHSSVRETLDLLERLGTQLHYCRLMPQGALDWEGFEAQVKEIRPHLVSLMAANNETGILFPIDRAASLCREQGILFHTDAVQGLGKLPKKMWENADFISVSAHKIGGPKGMGALAIRRSLKLIPTHYGGSQEIKRRGGTQNTIGIAGFGAACSELKESDSQQMRTLRDRFEKGLEEAVAGTHIQGKGAPRVANTSNIRFEGLSAELLLSALDLEGVCVSAGSACSSGSLTPSPVLLEIGLTPEQARECVRFSWGQKTTPDEVDTARAIVINVVTRIRSRRLNPAAGN